MLKREFERKQREEQEATAYAFQEFIRTFQDNSGPPSKTFVKSGIIYAKPGQEVESEKGKIYNPIPIIKHTSNTIKNAIECARLLKDNKIEKSRGQNKPKTNLELLKEELKLRHMERNERSKCKNELINYTHLSSVECNDPTTTNLFIANINPKVTEQELMQLFGAYGALASVKIMWPRNEDKNRTTNCGFVAFMSRKDGERALQALKDRDDMRIGWGKPVELPASPIYIPPELMKLSMPPPYSGLPFNAQPIKASYECPTNEEDMKELLYNSVVKVTIPLDKKMLMMVHRVIEFVVREGPLIEAIIMNQEINNPLFKFLFDNKNPVHVYYRWKLYSILQGEGQKYWSVKAFRMFEGGSIWIPPVIPNYSEGMPEHLINIQPKINKTYLSNAQKSRFIQLLQHLTLSRPKISEAMIFCMNHTDAAKEVVDILNESFENPKTIPTKKISRLYLITDVLYNSHIKKHETSIFCVELKNHLVNIFQQLQKTCTNLNKTADKDAFKSRIQQILRSWELWKIYSDDFLNQLETTFFGVSSECETENDSGTDEPLDGDNLIKRSIRTSSTCILDVGNNTSESKKNVTKTRDSLEGFIPSRWETVDPEQVEAQAMSTKKIFDIEMERKAKKHQKVLPNYGATGNDTKLKYERDALRNIELMVMQYQDDLESGKCRLPRDLSIEKTLKNYRKSLLGKMKKEYNRHVHNSSCNSSVSLDEEDKNFRSKYRKLKKKDMFKNKENERDCKKYAHK